ncbi:hypothetical protein CLU79DRAFT_833158 [Phycomyces nitens]|nr:hypothetical protein CLU79DRAFT_833158 [Phycomyces nitens]
MASFLFYSFLSLLSAPFGSVKPASRAAISFTGGKDSVLALHRIKDSGSTVAVLVTFCPPSGTPFRAHPITVIKQQAEALGIPHVVCTINGPDYLASYRQEIARLRKDFSIDALVTGDIMPVCSDFMERAVQTTGVSLVRPLWMQPREEILADMWSRNFDVIISCVNSAKLGLSDEECTESVGKKFSKEWLKKICSKNETVDAAGELGEFHTMVLDCPLFRSKVEVEGICGQDNSYKFLEIESTRLVPK